MNSKSKNWCFTINNPADDWADLNLLKGYTYCIVGGEIGEDGTPHYQGFVQMENRKLGTQMKKLLPRAHLEPMRATSEEARDYCKKDGNYVECPGPQAFISVTRVGGGGASGGLAKAARYKSAIALAKKADFDAMEEEHPDMYWNSYHTMKRIAMDNPQVPQTLNKLQNEWIYGVPGVGKSYKARTENPGVYIKLHNKWWLGYKGEKVVLYDDLSKTDATWIGDFLKTWCDHYPFPAETKGDGMVIRPEKIIVTSNYSIEELFGHDESLCSAIKRRFKVTHLVKPFTHFEAFDLAKTTEQARRGEAESTAKCNRKQPEFSEDEITWEEDNIITID